MNKRVLLPIIVGVALVVLLVPADAQAVQLPTTEWVGNMASGVVAIFFQAIAKVGDELISLMLKLIVPLLTVGTFIRHGFVRQGWPFVQGLANMGFILVLLFIAFATTLRLEGYSARRLLPRLLIAALLINFSLVIAGVIIDLSRIVMAVLIRLLGGDLGDVAGNVLNSSQLLSGVNQISQEIVSGLSDNQPLKGAASAILKALFTWILAGGLIVLIWGLFVRYVMLILLLVISPLAYLAIILPNTANLTKRWWNEFIKYVIYGPVVLAILLFMNKILSSQLYDDLANTGGKGALLRAFAALATTTILLVMATKAGSFIGVAGSAAVAGAVGKYGRRGAQAGAVGSARFLDNRLGKYSLRRNYQGYQDSRNKYKENQDKAYKAASPGARFGGAVNRGTRRYTKAGRNDRKEAAAAKAVGPIVPAKLTDARINATQLRKGHVAKALGETEVNNVVNMSANYNQPRAIAQNADYVKGLSSSQLADLQTAAASGAMSAGDKAKFGEELQKTLDTIAEG